MRYLAISAHSCLTFGIVLGVVLLTPTIVLKDVLKHGHGNHNRQGNGSHERTFWLSKIWHELQQDKEEKVSVRQLRELIEEVFWQEGQTRVLGCRDLVGHKVPVTLLLLKHCVQLEDAP